MKMKGQGKIKRPGHMGSKNSKVIICIIALFQKTKVFLYSYITDGRKESCVKLYYIIFGSAESSYIDPEI